MAADYRFMWVDAITGIRLGGTGAVLMQGTVRL